MDYNDQNNGYPQQNYGQPAYGQPVYGAPPQNDQPKGFGIASMVCGIVSIVICCCEYISIPLSITAIVLGIIALKKGSGKGFAIAGIACGGTALVFVAFCFILYYSGAVDTSSWQQFVEQLESMAGSEA